MRTSKVRSWIVRITGVVLAAALMPASADQPRVTAAIEQATATEAAAILSRESLVPVQVVQIPFDLPGQPPLPPTARRSFAWRNVAFPTALRELCAKFALQPGRTLGGGFTLYPNAGAEVKPPKKRTGLFQSGSLTMFASGLTLRINRSVRFDGAGFDNNQETLTMELGGRLEEGDADTLAELRGITAQDDRGNRLTAQVAAGERNIVSPLFPDEFTAGFTFPAPHPLARKLAWVRGEVMHYRTHRYVRIAVPIPAPGKRSSAEREDVVVEVVEFNPEPKHAPKRDEDDETESGAELKVRFASKSELPVAPVENPASVAPVLQDASGAAHDPISVMANVTPDRVLEMQCVYPKLKKPAAQILFRVVRRSDPEKLCSFELRDIPLPVAPPFVPERAPAPVAVPEGDHPYFQPGGGTLTQRVMVAGRAVSGGTLALGLAPRKGPGWGALRWVNVPIDEHGIARLALVRPGPYRIRRTYRPPAGAALPSGGRWESAETTVVVTAGKAAALPTLQWTPDKGRPGENTKGRKNENTKGKR